LSAAMASGGFSVFIRMGKDVHEQMRLKGYSESVTFRA